MAEASDRRVKEAFLRELEDLVDRAREFESRLERIREQAELRQQLERGGWPQAGTEQFARWREASQAVEGFYAAFGEFVGQAREAMRGLEAVIGREECEALAGRLHSSAVVPTRKALEQALERAREFMAAEAARRSRGVVRAMKAPANRDLAAGSQTASGGPQLDAPAASHASQAAEHKAVTRPPWEPRHWSEDEHGQAGRWVTAAEYARLTGLSEQTLANWRYRDRKAGRTEAEPGKPRYRYFGKAVRYWLPRDIERMIEDSNFRGPRPASAESAPLTTYPPPAAQ